MEENGNRLLNIFRRRVHKFLAAYLACLLILGFLPDDCATEWTPPSMTAPAWMLKLNEVLAILQIREFGSIPVYLDGPNGPVTSSEPGYGPDYLGLGLYFVAGIALAVHLTRAS